MVNKKGLHGSHAECMTIPYRSIQKFSKECDGLLNKCGKLKIWVAGDGKPLVKTFKKDLDIKLVYQLLSKYITDC